jgi:hypothetical protein
MVFENASHYLTVSGSQSDFVPEYLDTVTDWIHDRFGPQLLK